MGTWEDDSTTLLDPLYVTNKCISSYVTYNEENDADVKVAVDNVKVDVNGGECSDRESNPVAEGGGLVQQFERLEYEDEVNKDMSLIAIHHNETDVDAEIDAVNNNGDECCDHERNLVIEEGGVFQQFESLEFQNNVNKYVLSDGPQHKEYDVEVEAVNVNGDGCHESTHDDESHEVIKEVDLVQQFEKLEYQNNVNKDVSSVWSYHNENDVDVEFESGNVKRGGYCHGVIKEGDLVQQFVRQEFLNYGTEGSKRMERNGEVEHLKYYDDEKNTHLYPVRPYAVDCPFYIKTGTCKYGQSCKYNHPLMRGYQPVGDKEKQFEEISGSVLDAGKIQCKYFQTPGGCKYRDTCRYNHSAPKTERECLQLNFLGLPIRPSAQECTYYLRNGSCAYGASCKYNHPDPCAIEVSEPANGNSLENGKFVRGGTSLANNDGERMQSYGGESWGTSQSSNRKNVGNGLRYPSEMMSYHQAMPPAPGCNQNQVVNNYSKRVDPSVHYENLLQMEEFPERPGQPDCDYFMKTGNCKYRSACRYNHPTSQASKLRLPPLSSKLPYPCSGAAPMLCAESSLHHDQNSNNLRSNGSSFAVHQNHQMQNKEFPERPEQPECEYFMKTGHCKFMSSCRYHHPRSRALSSSQCNLNEKGLPLRPGAKLCRNYEQLGMCKYNVNCLYDHPDGLVI